MNQRPSGKVNLIAVVVIAAVLGGIWWIVNYAGVYLDNLGAHDAVRGAFNQAFRETDMFLKHDIENKLNLSTAGEHEETDALGVTKTAKGLGITDDDIEVERDEVAKTISITLTYKRKVVLFPWLGKNNVRWLTFREHKQGPIKAPEGF